MYILIIISLTKYLFTLVIEHMRKQQSKQREHFSYAELFNKSAQYVRQLTLLKKIFDVQFSQGEQFQNEQSMKKVITQLQIIEVANLKQALLLLLVCFRRQHIVKDLLQYEQIDRFQGERSKSANAIKDALTKYKCNPSLNPITDFKQIMNLMQNQYSASCSKAVLQTYNESDAKHLFYETFIKQNEKTGLQQKSSFSKLNISLVKSYPANNSSFVLESLKRAEMHHVVEGIKKYCHIYICPKKTDIDMSKFWILAFQSIRQQKLKISAFDFQRMGYIESLGQRNKRISDSASHSKSPQRPPSPPNTKAKDSPKYMFSPKKQASPGIQKQQNQSYAVSQSNRLSKMGSSSSSAMKGEARQSHNGNTNSKQKQPNSKVILDSAPQNTKQIDSTQRRYHMPKIFWHVLIVLIILLAIIMLNMWDEDVPAQTYQFSNSMSKEQ